MHPDLQIYWDAFWELSSDRQIGMAIGRIPFSAIDRYARRYGLDDVDEFDRFREIIRSMDAEFRRISTPPDKTKRTEVSVTDVEGVRSLFSRLQERQEEHGDS